MLENVKVLYGEEAVQERIAQLAKQIDEDYAEKTLTVICVLKGAVFFTVDLLKQMKTQVSLEMMQVSSYEGTETTGKITIKKDLEQDISGKDVLIVEDIVDTGYTLQYLKEYLQTKQPNSLKIAVLTDKAERRKVDVKLDYTGFVIPNEFIVGYGMDYDEIGRNLPYIGYIKS